jgi:glucosamine-phosphate N-acetyltransferase
MEIRDYREEDNGLGFLQVLRQLTTALEDTAGTADRPEMVVLVAEIEGRIRGTARLVVEPKFNGLNVGHVEDVVVDAEYRNRGVASALLQRLLEVAKQRRCYKCVLGCTVEKEAFYMKFGFQAAGTQMRINL